MRIVTTIFLLLCTAVTALSQNPGFENNLTDWSSSGEGSWSINTSANYFRTGLKSAKLSTGATTDGKLSNSNYHVTTPASGTNYITIIAWVRASDNNHRVAVGASNGSTETRGTEFMVSDTSFSRIHYTFLAQNGVTYYPFIYGRKDHETSTTLFKGAVVSCVIIDLYYDDVIIYTGTADNSDLTPPNPDSCITASPSGTQITLTWKPGTDNPGGSGIDGVLILRRSGTLEDNQDVNNQAFYSSTNPLVGPTAIAGWNVVYNGSTTTTYTDDPGVNGIFTYLIYMRDKAYNYTANVSAQSSAGRIYVFNGNNLSSSTTRNTRLDGLFLPATCTFTSNPSSTVTIRTGANIAIQGTLINRGNVYTWQGARVTFENGSVYEYRKNGYEGGYLFSLLQATWNPGSTCMITGITDSFPLNLDQTFANLVWNCPLQIVADTLASSTAPAIVTGNWTIDATGTGKIFLSSVAGSNTVQGNFIKNSGTVDAGTAGATLLLNGSSTQRIKISGGDIQGSFSLNLDNPAGLYLETDLLINGTLYLTEGLVYTDTKEVIIGEAGSVSRTNGHVAGYLTRLIPTGSPAVSFDIGDNLYYSPIYAQFGTVTGSGGLTASTKRGDHPSIASSGLIEDRTVNRYYSLVNSGITFDTSNIVFNFVNDDLDPGARTNLFEARKYDSPNWTAPGLGNRTSTSTEATGVSSFSDFAVGEPPTYTITASASAGGTINPSDEVLVVGGHNQAFIITPSANYHIDSMLVDDLHVDSTVSYTFYSVNSNHTIETFFSINKYTLNISAVNGTVTKEPDQSTYNHDTNVQLTANPNPGYHFTGWSGDAGGSDNPLTVLMDGNKNITAHFAINTYTLNISATNGSVEKLPDQSTYNHGTNVQLTAIPNPGYHFTGWSGDAGGSDNPLTVLMDGNKNITAQFAINTYTLNTSAINGSVIKLPDQSSYDYGTNVQLTADPNPGYQFVNWSGDAGGSDNPLTVLMDGNKNITAIFAINAYTLTVSAVNGSVAKLPNQATYEYGANVQLTANPNPGYHFTGWSGDAGGNDNPLIVLMDGNKNITAHFAINTYTLNISAVNGSVTKLPDLPSYDHGVNVQLTAIPDPGYRFISWSGDAGGSNNPLTVLMDGNKNITANFALNAFSLTVVSVNGSVTKIPDQLTYEYGSIVQLTAIPNPGYHFTGWSGDAGGSDNPLTVLIDNNKSITANYAINAYTLNITATNGTVTKVPDQSTYEHGTNVQLSAVPDPGYHFINWSGDASGTDNPLSLVMDGNKNITADFGINTYSISLSVNGEGTVTKNPEHEYYNYGSTVTLTAIPDNLSWIFSHWGGDLTGNSNPAEVLIDAAKSITATFIRDTAYLIAYRTFAPESLALDRDNKGKLNKYVKRKPYLVEFTCIIHNDAGELQNDLHLHMFSDLIQENPSFPVSIQPPPDRLIYKGTILELYWDEGIPIGDSVVINGWRSKATRSSKLSCAWHPYAGGEHDRIILAISKMRLPMPNRVNALYETFLHGGFTSTNGLVIGEARIDSPKYYAWLQSGKYTDVMKTLIVKRNLLMHSGNPTALIVSMKGKPISKRFRSLSPNKHNNVLLADMIALKLNIITSAMRITPPGMGELIYQDSIFIPSLGIANALNGKTAAEIAWVGDSVMMGYHENDMHRPYDPAIYQNLHWSIARINKAFEGPLDTVSFADSLVFKGTRQLLEIPYLRANPEAISFTINPTYAIDEVPTEYALYQNYPNPFNPTTTIGFDLPQEMLVTVKVYNLLGQEIGRLVDGEELEEGSHEFEFDASNLASGVYFYGIEVYSPDNKIISFSNIRKMILLK